MESTMQRIASFVRSTIVIAGIVVSAAGNAGAQQQQAAGGWQGWVGCWTAGPAIGGIAPSATSPLVCLAPTADANVVDVTTIGGGKVLSTQRIDASGREQTLASNDRTSSLSTPRMKVLTLRLREPAGASPGPEFTRR